MPYVVFISLWDMADLCPNGADLCMKLQLLPVLLFCPFIPLSGAPIWTGWELGYPSRRGCLSVGRNSNSNCSWDYLEDPMEKAMAPHSSTLAWQIPWMEEPGGLQSMGLLRVGHDWVTSLSLFTFMRWRRKWQPTPVFLPGDSQGWGSLVGCCLWGRTESDTTEAT